MSKILIVDDNNPMRELLKRILETKDYEVIEASGGEKALELVDLKNPDIAVLDLMMPGIDGVEVLASIKSRPDWAKIYVIILTALPDEEIRALSLGADAYMTKPFDRELLLAHVERGVKYVNEQRAATKEPVTGFQSREVVEATIKHQVGISKRYDRHLSMLILDVNQIELIRQTRGDLVGNQTINLVAEVIYEQCRTTDIPARWFKDELVIILPETSLELAMDVAERIRVKIEGMRIDGVDLTASVGVSDMLKLPVDRFVSHYRHLYESKKNINKVSMVGKR